MHNLRHLGSLPGSSYRKLGGLHLQATEAPTPPSSHPGEKSTGQVTPQVPGTLPNHPSGAVPPQCVFCSTCYSSSYIRLAAWMFISLTHNVLSTHWNFSLPSTPYSAGTAWAPQSVRSCKAFQEFPSLIWLRSRTSCCEIEAGSTPVQLWRSRSVSAFYLPL